jgi:aspartate 1-decarboxylase
LRLIAKLRRIVGNTPKGANMGRTFVSGKVHQLKVTGLNAAYNGSCLICPELLAAAGISSFERVEIYSLTTTARIATYVFPGAKIGEFTLRGGAALHFKIGDQVAVVAYREEEQFSGANCVIVDPSDNSILQQLRYEAANEATNDATDASLAAPTEVSLTGARPPGSDTGLASATM